MNSIPDVLSRPSSMGPGSSFGGLLSKKQSKSNLHDRFIPSREGLDLQTTYKLAKNGPPTPTSARKRENIDLEPSSISDADKTYTSLLKTELFGSPFFSNTQNSPDSTPQTSIDRRLNPSTPSRTSQSNNIFSYSSPSRTTQTPSSSRDLPTHEIYSLSPVKFDSQRLLLSPRPQTRAISKTPFKVLDAPELQDDFYLNLVDWGSTNQLAVGLGSCVYIWNAQSGQVTKVCDMGDLASITSVSWIQRGSHIAIGTNLGTVQIWDTEVCRRTRTMTGHTDRVACLSWNEHVLSSGGRDYKIFHRDVRVPDHYFRRLTEHRQEVCGLNWNREDGQLASGGNDNQLFVWNGLENQYIHKFSKHVAAVKAIGWSPHQRGILASGGGTADRTIKFWNTITGNLVNEIDTGSQVCNLAWSKTSNEIVSTHGYSENQITIWKYPSMTQLAGLKGHTCRVLYLAVSPDGQTIVTGAGDETLRFWNVFNSPNKKKKQSLFDPIRLIR